LEGAWAEAVPAYLEYCPVFEARNEENHEKFQSEYKRKFGLGE
jgi:hypothetical protein